MLAAIRLAESAARIEAKAMKINLEGGYIETIGEWKDIHGNAKPMYRAYSSHTNSAIECFSRGLAEFYVWVVNEKYASMGMRSAI